MVKLIGRTLEQTRVFVLIYLATIAIFSVINKVLGNEIENSFDAQEGSEQEPEYRNIHSALMNLVLMFRNAIGDYQIPNYKYWSTQLDEAQSKGGSGSVLEPTVMVYIIWLFWFGIIIFLPIVQLNFLIAFISEAFEDVLDTSMEILYVQRCKLNLEYYIVRRFASNIKGCFCSCLMKRKIGCEIYLISGAANSENGKNGEGNSEGMGVVHKLKGVLKEVKQGIFKQFQEASSEFETIKAAMIEQGNELKQQMKKNTAEVLEEASKVRQENDKKLRNTLKQEFKEEIGGLKDLIQELLNNQNLQ